MSKRPITQKKVNRIRKMLRQTPPAQIDLVQWLQAHGHADSAGQARQLIASGRVQSESHPLGREEIEEHKGLGLPGHGAQRYFGNPRVAASLRDSIVVRRAGKS